MRDRLQADLTDALKARDRVRAGALRSVLSAIANAEAVEVVPGTTATELERRVLRPEEVRAIVEAERDGFAAGAAHLGSLGRLEEAAEAAARAEVLAAHLDG